MQFPGIIAIIPLIPLLVKTKTNIIKSKIVYYTTVKDKKNNNNSKQ